MKIVCQTFIWFLFNGGTDLKELRAETLFDSLAVITDLCLERHKRHSLIDILVIARCASICEVEGWEDIEEFGIAKHERFAEEKRISLRHLSEIIFILFSGCFVFGQSKTKSN